MRQFSSAVRTSATAATANIAGAGLWNPGTRAIWLNQISWFKTVATADNIAVLRNSARGTATNLAAVQSNDHDYMGAPFSTAGVDVAYTVQPTLVSATAYLFRAHMGAAVGAGFIWNVPGLGIEIPPGAGIVLVTPPATVLQPADCTFVWTE